jgi:hypothetical protein
MDFRGPAAGMVKEDEVGGLDKEALRRILEKPPLLHSGADFGHGSKEDLVSWGIQASFLQYMSDVVHPGNVTLETGSGLSTICFAILEAEHTCVTPAQQEFDRIRTYCHEHGISTAGFPAFETTTQPSLMSGLPSEPSLRSVLRTDRHKWNRGIVSGALGRWVPNASDRRLSIVREAWRTTGRAGTVAEYQLIRSPPRSPDSSS